MVDIVQILDGIVKVDISVPEIILIDTGERIGSASLISWASIKLPTLVATFPFNRKWILNAEHKRFLGIEPFGFKFYLLKEVMETVQSFCRELAKKKGIPFPEFNVHVDIAITNISRFADLEYTKKKKLRLMVSPLVVTENNGQVPVPRFRRFLRNFIREYRRKIDLVVGNKLVLIFSNFLAERDRFYVQSKLLSDGFANISRGGFVPTTNPRKLRPLTKIHLELEFPNLDRGTLQSLFHSVASERGLTNKLSKLSFILSLMNFDVLSCSYENRIADHYYVEYNVDLNTPEGVRKLVELLKTWIRRNGDDETSQNN